ncbi:MAG: penicillin-binding protein activator [Pseudomonadota bacterium]
MAYTIPDRASRWRSSGGIGVMLLATLLAMSGCESLPGNLGTDYSAARAQRLFEAGDYDAAAAGWMSLANDSQGEQRSGYLLRATEAWLEDGDGLRAQAALDQISASDSPSLTNDLALSRAALAALNADSANASAALDQADAQRFTVAQRARADAIRGQIAFLDNDPASAVTLLVRRELWLGSEVEIARNDQKIWDGLLTADPEQLQTGLAQVSDQDVAGWLALGLLAGDSAFRQSAGKLESSRGLVSWQRQYPGHPALRTILGGRTDTVLVGTEPRQIALLLPLSGRASAFGSTIRDGVLAHYANRFAGALTAPAIEVYDVSGTEAVVAYEQAIADGADLVIGPVLRSSVDALASYTGARVPTLLLNYPTITETYSANVFAFGLAPEDEARAAAIQAFEQGHRRAVALLPTGSRGERLLTAFNEAFSALGGAVLNYEIFVPEAADHSNEIERLMLLTDSVARYRRLRDLIGAPLQFEPRRRADVDVIFLGANANNASQLKPQLRFHYAGDIPVIATSSVNEAGTTESVNDLNGVEFAEIPWLLDRMSGRPTPLDRIDDTLLNVRRQPRLFALGHDALSVGLSIYANNVPLTGIEGATGLLLVDDLGNVTRQPGWARFERGRPVSIRRRVGETASDGGLAPFGDDVLATPIEAVD